MASALRYHRQNAGARRALPLAAICAISQDTTKKKKRGQFLLYHCRLQISHAPVTHIRLWLFALWQPRCAAITSAKALGEDVVRPNSRWDAGNGLISTGISALIFD